MRLVPTFSHTNDPFGLLAALVVVISGAFSLQILDTLTCNPPIIRGIFPDKYRKYNDTQDIHLEPNVRRCCETSNNPVYRWVLHHNGRPIGRFDDTTLYLPNIVLPRVEAFYPMKTNAPCLSKSDLTSTTFDRVNASPSRTRASLGSGPAQKRTELLELYDYLDEILALHGVQWVPLEEGTGTRSTKESVEDEIPLNPFLPSLLVGIYRAELTISEKFSQSSTETNFTVDSLPLSVQFLGGTIRRVEISDNITLNVEIRAPVDSFYNISINCYSPKEKNVSCFTDPSEASSYFFYEENSSPPTLFQRFLNHLRVEFDIDLTGIRLLASILENYFSSQLSASRAYAPRPVHRALVSFLSWVQGFTEEETRHADVEDYLRFFQEWARKWNKPNPSGTSEDYASSVDSSTGGYSTFAPYSTQESSTSKNSSTKEYVTSVPFSPTDNVTSTPFSTKHNVTFTPSSTKYDVTSTPSSTKDNVTSAPPSTESYVTSSPPSTESYVTLETSSQPSSNKTLEIDLDELLQRVLDLVEGLPIVNRLLNMLNTLMILMSAANKEELVDSTVLSVTFPSSLLRTGVSSVTFEFSASTIEDYSTSSQTLMLSDLPTDRIGIMHSISSESPFGTTRRAVFESKCETCSKDEIEVLEYSWKLEKIIINPPSPPSGTEPASPPTKTVIDSELTDRQLQLMMAVIDYILEEQCKGFNNTDRDVTLLTQSALSERVMGCPDCLRMGQFTNVSAKEGVSVHSYIIGTRFYLEFYSASPQTTGASANSSDWPPVPGENGTAYQAESACFLNKQMGLNWTFYLSELLKENSLDWVSPGPTTKWRGHRPLAQYLCSLSPTKGAPCTDVWRAFVEPSSGGPFCIAEWISDQRERLNTSTGCSKLASVGADLLEGWLNRLEGLPREATRGIPAPQDAAGVLGIPLEVDALSDECMNRLRGESVSSPSPFSPFSRRYTFLPPGSAGARGRSAKTPILSDSFNPGETSKNVRYRFLLSNLPKEISLWGERLLLDCLSSRGAEPPELLLDNGSDKETGLGLDAKSGSYAGVQEQEYEAILELIEKGNSFGVELFENSARGIPSSPELPEKTVSNNLENSKMLLGENSRVFPSTSSPFSRLYFGARGKVGMDDDGRSPYLYEENTTRKFAHPTLTFARVPLPAISSTGPHKRVLVLYPDNLNSSYDYLLTLETFNPLSNKTGLAKLLLQFSPKPILDGCVIYSIGSTEFRSSCQTRKGFFFPTDLRYSYHFLYEEPKVLFYSGSLPFIDFTLPSGLTASNHTVYVTIQAVDSNEVSSDEFVFKQTVKPKYVTPLGLLSIFLQTKILVHENSALELQKIRSLAWELNIAPNYDIYKMVDKIYAMLSNDSVCLEISEDLHSFLENEEFLTFYSKKLSLGDSRLMSEIAKVILIKSCSRYKLVIMTTETPLRNEMEVLMVLTALQLLLDVPDYLSWLTYKRSVNALYILKQYHLWYWNPKSRYVAEVTYEYFFLASAVLKKQYEIYDCTAVPHYVVDDVINYIFAVMAKEIATRFLEEEPLQYKTDYLNFAGFLASAEDLILLTMLGTVIFYDENSSDSPGLHTIMMLQHYRTPYAMSPEEITSYVLNLQLTFRALFFREIMVALPRSSLATEDEYDFRKVGRLTRDSIRVYNFEVGNQHSELSFQVTLELTKIYSPVSALLLICNDMQSLDDPFVSAVLAPSQSEISIFLEPGTIPVGSYVLVIVEENSYYNLRAPKNEDDNNEKQGAQYKLGVWWSLCYMMKDSNWVSDNCQAVESTWDSTNCLCAAKGSSTFGARTFSAVTNEDLLDVNESILVKTFGVVYILIGVLAVYAVFFVVLSIKEKTRTRRKNVWLPANDHAHPFSYLVTISTGTQWNAGTTSKVYGILHGTDDTSSTREMESPHSKDLFTRGSVCSFIWTSPVSLGDIQSVQLWHDNTGDEKGWFVCEVSVADLATGMVWLFPCYRWFSIAAEDGQVAREVSMETPTSFIEDFEHFLPQNGCEHVLWMSLFSSSKQHKHYKLQRVTILVNLALMLGTLSFVFVQMINKSHTMMTPDLHIEPLLCATIISAALIPVEWALSMIFKATNNLEDKEFYKGIVREMIQETYRTRNSRHPKKRSADRTSDQSGSSSNNDSDENDICNPDSRIWRQLQKWAFAQGPVEVSERFAHPGFVKSYRDVTVPMLLNLRKRTLRMEPDSFAYPDFNTAPEEDGDGVVGDGEADAVPEVVVHYSDPRYSEMDIALKKFKTSKFSLLAQSAGWVCCLIIAACCCLTFWKRGWGMSKDYTSLWMQTVYMSICVSVFIFQPLMIATFTLCQVIFYRWIVPLKFFKFYFSDAFILEQAIAVWQYYKRVLARKEKAKKTTEEERQKNELEKRARDRRLKFTRPPTEGCLMRKRSKLIMREEITSLLVHLVRYSCFLVALIYLITGFFIEEKYSLNETLLRSMQNGSCIEKNDLNYRAFTNISSLEEWWQWAHSELLDITYGNRDPDYSSLSLFCDTSSILIGDPRLRVFVVDPVPCSVSASSSSYHSNVSLDVDYCYPDYKSDEAALRSFASDGSSSYWDRHYLSIIHGTFGDYGYTEDEKFLPSSRFGATFFLLSLFQTGWIPTNGSTRAIIVEFSLYHPQSRLHSTVDFIAEFPSLSGEKSSYYVASAKVEIYENYASIVTLFADLFLLTCSMILFTEFCSHLVECRFRIWKHPWYILDFLKMFFSSLFVVSILLRVRIAEDLTWLLKMDYYMTYVNLMALMEWNDVIRVSLGLLMALHLVRCLWLLKFVRRLRILMEVLASGLKDAFTISLAVLFFAFSCSLLGLNLFGRNLYLFHSYLNSFSTVLLSWSVPWCLNPYFEGSYGWQLFWGNTFFTILFLLFAYFVFGLYKAAFINAKKYHVSRPDSIAISLTDLAQYFKHAFYYWKRKFKPHSSEKEEVSSISHSILSAQLAELEIMVEVLDQKIDNFLSLKEVNFEKIQATNSGIQNTEWLGHSYSHLSRCRLSPNHCNACHATSRRIYFNSCDRPYTQVDELRSLEGLSEGSDSEDDTQSQCSYMEYILGQRSGQVSQPELAGSPANASRQRQNPGKYISQEIGVGQEANFLKDCGRAFNDPELN